jgi:hypothetical protein
MGEAGGRARLAHETAPPIAVQCELGDKNLQRDLAVEPGVGGEEHLTHAARPDVAGDLILTEARSRGE